MIKTLVKQMSKKDRKFSIITPFLIIGEVTMETTIPMLMATLVDVGIQNSDIGYVVKMGLLWCLWQCFHSRSEQEPPEPLLSLQQDLRRI